ncbi:protein moonraker isoform X2 [Thalassophryne amazonica]|uniref:protein moonraker isoform X2 n=1 Tax=Thalassophryne amazonica TaxID=390379 RepID=UPI001470DE09|nr:protein moonraker isoform X2 [Thalassophryne amazonica]
MAAQFSQTFKSLHHGREWVTLEPAPRVPTGLQRHKVLFYDNMLTSVTCDNPPAAVIIEKLLRKSDKQQNTNRPMSNIKFTIISEERMQAAVTLAKRDLRRWRLEAVKKSSVISSHENSVLSVDEMDSCQDPSDATGKAEMKLSNPEHMAVRCGPAVISDYHSTSQSPPTTDRCPKQVDGHQQHHLKQQIQKLHNELETYIEKLEKMADLDKEMEEPLDCNELKKIELCKQMQAARSARMIYVVQQQVNRIQEDLEKPCSQQMWANKKLRAIERLSAAHRGAVRVLKVIIPQLSDLSHNEVPPYYKELQQLIRRLSLCSAELEGDQGSSVSEQTLNIIQKLETCHSALNRQKMIQQMPIQTRSSSPSRWKSPKHPAPPLNELMDPVTSHRGPRKAQTSKTSNRGQRLALQNHRTTHFQTTQRRELLQAGLQSLMEQRERRATQKGAQKKTKARLPLLSERTRADIKTHKQKKEAHFGQPTVSSQLKKNEIPQKDNSVPWRPASHHFPPQQYVNPKGLPESSESPVKTLPSPTKKMPTGFWEELCLSAEKRKPPEDEAKRLEFLIDGKEQQVREMVKLNLNASQAAESAEQLAEALVEGQMEYTARTLRVTDIHTQLEGLAPIQLQVSTLDRILLRMEEIQRDQEEVRRRLASIHYSDPLYCDQLERAGPQSGALTSSPASPQPMRLTKPVLSQSSAAQVILEKLVDDCAVSEESLMEEVSRDEQLPSKPHVIPRSTGTIVSVPGNVLRNIWQYKEEYEAYLQGVEHVHTFDPWFIADRLADELLSEVTGEVAAEFQDIMDKCTEAVFTAEFHSPPHSPSTSALTIK